MGPLDFRDVEEAGGTADQGPAGKVEFRDGLKTAFVEDAGAIREAFAAFEEVFEERVVFHSLEGRSRCKRDALA